MSMWQPIETAPKQTKVLLYAPPHKLYVNPKGMAAEMRVARAADYTWATHWMPLPKPPTK